MNKSYLPRIIFELLRENIIRGAGLLTHAIIRAQITSPSYAPVYAALVSTIVNKKLPVIGELICKRVVSTWRELYMSNKTNECFAMNGNVPYTSC